MRQLRLELPTATFYYHQWINYIDGNGCGKCEPEVFAILPEEVILAEVKLTGNAYAVKQMQGLYAPLLSHLFKRPVRCLQICKGVSPLTPGPFVDSPAQFVTSGVPYAVWHWLGR